MHVGVRVLVFGRRDIAVLYRILSIAFRYEYFIHNEYGQNHWKSSPRHNS